MMPPHFLAIFTKKIYPQTTTLAQRTLHAWSKQIFIEMRSMTIGLLLNARFTKSTSNIDLHT